MIYVDMYGFMITDGNLPELHDFAKKMKLDNHKDFFPARYPHYRLCNIVGGKRIASYKKIEQAFNLGAVIVSSEKMKVVNDEARELRRLTSQLKKKNPDLK